MPVTLGSTRLLTSGRLKGRRVGIVSNPASVDAGFTHIVDALMQSPDVTLGAIFGPQHGFRSDVQDNMIETPHGNDCAPQGAGVLPVQRNARADRGDARVTST